MAGVAFYPSCVVNLRLRFDEAFSSVSVDAVSVDDLAGADQAVPFLPPTGADLPPIPMLLPPTVSRQLVAPELLGGAKDDLSHVMGIVPRTGTFELAGYRQAHRFSLGFLFRDIPLDPRVVRAIGVEVHLGTVPADEFGQGIASADDPRKSVLRTRDAGGGVSQGTQLLVGTADTISTEFSDGSMVVTIEGRNLVGILIDAKVTPQALARLRLDQPIDQVVVQILELLPFGAGIAVSVDAAEWPDGSVPSPLAVGDVTRVLQSADGQSVQGQAPQGKASDLSFWDIITQYCLLVGAVPFFVGEVLRIRPARNLFDQRRKTGSDPRFPTPFTGGGPRVVQTESGAESLTLRRLVYGRNVGSLKFERKLGGTKVPTVEVVSVDTSSEKRGAQRLLSARWPDAASNSANAKVVGKVQAARATSVAPSGQVAQEDVVRISVPGIRSVDRLREIARATYEEIGRGEMGGSLVTKSLSSFGGDNEDADLLRLRPGDPIELVLDTTNLGTRPGVISELTDHGRRSLQEEVSAVFARVGDLKLARVLVASARGAGDTMRFFRVANVKFDWSQDQGVTVSFDFQTYVEARYDVGGEQPSPARLPKTTRAK